MTHFIVLKIPLKSDSKYALHFEADDFRRIFKIFTENSVHTQNSYEVNTGTFTDSCKLTSSRAVLKTLKIKGNACLITTAVFEKT